MSDEAFEFLVMIAAMDAERQSEAITSPRHQPTIKQLNGVARDVLDCLRGINRPRAKNGAAVSAWLAEVQRRAGTNGS